MKNRSLTSALKEKTLYEAVFGKRPDVSHVRVFGCEAYVHVPKERRSKLDSKSEKCIFIGYKDGIKGYKLWNPDTRSVTYSRDVVFREFKPNEIFPKAPEEPQTVELDVGLKEDAVNSQVGVESSNSEAAEHNEVEDEDSETEAEVEAPMLRRSTRERRPSERYTPENYILCASDNSCALNITGDDPITVRQARNSEDAKQWEEAMKEEMKSLMKNQTWSLENLPADRKAIGCKWVFKKKVGANGEIERYKARLVAKGYSQTEGVDYGEVFSPVAKLNSIRLVLSVAAAYDLEVEQLDVKTAFLHGDLEEVIYMKQPEGFVARGKEELVCKLNKSLYGLKQSPRMWYQKFDTYAVKLGFDRCDADHCVYVKRLEGEFVILTLYVDDMLLVGNSLKMISTVKGLLAKKFEMKDVGAANVILGMQIKREHDKRRLLLSQRKYIEDGLKKFKMIDCKLC